MKNKVDSGVSIPSLPGRPVEAGEPFLYGSFFGVPATSVKDNQSRVTLHLVGTYDFRYKNDSKFTAGDSNADKVYFDPAKNEITSDSSQLWVGVAVENSTQVDPNEKIYVVRTRLNGVPLLIQKPSASATPRSS